MESIKVENTIAVVIAIENYRFPDVSSVKYALDDAESFSNILIDKLNVKPENIIKRTDSLASNTALNDEIKYIIRNLTATDRFIFYYAGHGFYDPNEGNRLTAWDSSMQNLTDTTLSLRELVLTPLLESNCKQSLIFLDACAKELKDRLTSRDAIGELSSRELEKYLKDVPYNASYYACSPTEKSYSDDTLKHGIWSYYLFQALSGQAENALINNTLTDMSLRDYLKTSVQNFIANKTTIRHSQTPFASINSSNSFSIFEFPKIPESSKEETDQRIKLKLLSRDIILVNESLVDIGKAPGFKRNHYLPDNKSVWAKSFVTTVFEPMIEQELQDVYLKSKEILALKRINIRKDVSRLSEGIGLIETPFFTYTIRVQQDDNYITYGSFKRQLKLKVEKENLPNNFDYVFPVSLNVIYIPVSLDIKDFDSLVDEFEDLVEEKAGKLLEDDVKKTITYTSNDKVSYEFFFKEGQLRISIGGHSKISNNISVAENFISNVGTNEE